MSSCKFKNGKCKGGGEVSAYLRHSCATEENRKRVRNAKDAKGEYCNIDVSRSHLNYNIDLDTHEAIEPETYGRMWSRYKEREIAVEDMPTQTNHRKDRVTAIFVEAPFPELLSGDIHTEDGKRWAGRFTEIMQEMYGKENVFAVCVHMDEVHDYVDTRSMTLRESRTHIHCGVITEHDGSFNGKWISKQSNMTKLNRAIEAMTQREFGCPFMTGEKYKSEKTVQELKAESARLEAEAKYQAMLQKRDELQADIDVLEEQKKKSLTEVKQLGKEKSALEDEIERIKVKSEIADTRYKEAVETYKEVNKDAEDLINDINNLFMTRYQEFINRRDTDLSRKAFLEGRKMKTKDGEVISEEEFYKRCSSGKKAEQDKEIEKEKKEAIEEAERLLSKYRGMHEERVRQAEKIIAVPPATEEEDEEEDENNVDIFLTKKMLRKIGI